MCTEINYIRAVIDNYDISLTWLAKQINKKFHSGLPIMTKQRLSYIKECGKEISTTLYKEIRSILDEHNYKLSDFDESHLIGKMVAELNSESAELVSTTMKALENNVVDETERADLMLQAELIKQRLNKIEILLREK